MALKTLSEIYQKAPILEDIAKRLNDSEEQIKDYNLKNKKNREAIKTGGDQEQQSTYKTRFKQRYPEHFVIDKIFKNNRWETMAQLPASGRKEFESRLLQIVTTRNPEALHIDIYAGKTQSPTVDFTASLTDDENVAAAIEESKKDGEALLGLLESKIQSWENKLEQNKATNPANSLEAMQSKFELQIIDLKHNQKISDLTRDFQAQLAEKDREIDELEREIEDLEEQLDEQDQELGSAAEKIKEKQSSPRFQNVLATIAETALTGVIVKNPSLLTKGLGMSPDAVKEIIAEMQTNKQIEEAKPSAPSGSATFEEVTDDFSGFDPKHKESIVGMIDFLKSLSFEQFKMIYHVFFFMYNEESNSMDEENAKKLIAHIFELQKK